MSDKKSTQLILQVANNHHVAFPYPTFLSPRRGRYVGFFANKKGDQWLFLYDRELGGGLLFDGDNGWEVYHLGSGSAPVLSLWLADDERFWLLACWEATAEMRRGAAAVDTSTVESRLKGSYWD